MWFGKKKEMTEKAKELYEEATSLLANGDFNNAIEYYNKAIEEYPDYAVAYNDRGITYFEVQEFSKAIKDYSKAIESDPQLCIAYINRGNAYKLLGKLKDAISDYNQALDVDNNFEIDAFMGLGLCYSHNDLKDYDTAIKYFTKIIEKYSAFSDAYYYRALTYAARTQKLHNFNDFEINRIINELEIYISMANPNDPNIMSAMQIIETYKTIQKL